MSDAENALENELRTRLLSRLERLTGRKAALAKHLRGQDGRNDADFADRVSFNQADEVLEQLDDAGRREIAQIRAALDRLDDNSYRVCARCGDDIGVGRLRAVPYTVLCVDCSAEES